MAINVGCAGEPQVESVSVKQGKKMVEKSEEQWREQLTHEQFEVLRESGTERAFTGEYTDTETPGTYVCAGCDSKLFQSSHKFHSGCGWPSFYLPFEDGAITRHSDFQVTREICYILHCCNNILLFHIESQDLCFLKLFEKHDTVNMILTKL